MSGYLHYLHRVDSDGESRVVPVHLRVFDLVLILSGPLLMCGMDPVHADHYNHHQGGDTNHNNSCGCWRCCPWKTRREACLLYYIKYNKYIFTIKRQESVMKK